MTKLSLVAVVLIFLMQCYPEIKQGLPPTDDALYSLYADRITKGDFSEPSPDLPNSHYKHRYIVVYMLAGFYKVLGVNIFSTMLPFILCSVLSLLLIYQIGKKIGGEHVGVSAAFLLAIYPPFLRVSARALSEPVLIMLVLAMFYCVIAALKEPLTSKKQERILLFSAGVLFALSVNTHLFNLLLLPPLALSVFFLCNRKFRPSISASMWPIIGMIFTYVLFAICTPGLIGKQATTQLSYDISTHVTTDSFFYHLLERGRRVLIPAFLFGDDAHYQLFGLAHQLFLIGTEYDLKHSLFHTLLFIAALVFFFIKRKELLPIQRRLIAATTYPLFILYLLYEFIGLFIVRKLGRYFILLPILTIIPSAYFFSYLTSPKSLQRLLISIALFLLSLTVLWHFGVSDVRVTYLLLLTYFILLVFLLWDRKTFLANAVIGMFVAVLLSQIYGKVVSYNRPLHKEPLEYLYSSFAPPWNIYTTNDVELEGMADWNVMSGFYAGFDEQNWHHTSVSTPEELEKLENGFLFSRAELSATKFQLVRRFPSGVIAYQVIN